MKRGIPPYVKDDGSVKDLKRKANALRALSRVLVFHAILNWTILSAEIILYARSSALWAPWYGAMSIMSQVSMILPPTYILKELAPSILKVRPNLVSKATKRNLLGVSSFAHESSSEV
jgi:hypothetical protein